MKMHQFAFVQKCPALTSIALPPPPLNAQLTLSGGNKSETRRTKLKIDANHIIYRRYPLIFLILSFHLFCSF